MLAAFAGDIRLGRNDVLEAELELSHQSQPSAAAFSLFGNTLPDARGIDPKTNLNHQPWGQPVVFDGSTASLRWTHQLDAQWRTVAQAMTQQLRTDDRMAFPYGCSAEGHYDRYCSDGSYDLYDFRSEGERRNTHVLSLRVEGQVNTGAVSHQLSVGALGHQFSGRFNPQIYNYAGVGTLDGQTVVPAAPTPTAPSTNRSEHSTEVHAFDQMHLGDAGLWLGLRNTQLTRESVGTDGSSDTRYSQSFTTPWAALTWQINPADMAYVSAGQGVESYVTPNLPIYGTQAGQVLPAQRSRPTEVGVKHETQPLAWAVAAFDIHRPHVDTSAFQVDGTAHHLGLEASTDLREGPWSLHASAQWLKARLEGSSAAANNGMVPTNVPQRSARLQAGYQPASLPGLALYAHIDAEGPREVLPDNSLATPGWSTLGLSARQNLRADGHDWTLRAGVDNLLNRRAWQETPYQYGHVYLYPLAPRTFRISAQVSL
jgi:iron complex outermembrane receptor protein